MINKTLHELPAITATEREQILAEPRTQQAHSKLLNALPAMNAVQLGGQAQSGSLPSEFTIAAWNVERCLFPEESAAHLGDIMPDVVLLSEVDHGMSRTSQRHTTQDFAASMGMCYAYGVEFFEMGLGGPTEREFCKDDFNEKGWHGNAILSSVPMLRTAMVRLDQSGHWFCESSGADDAEQPRIGGRMALLAELPVDGGTVTVVSTHLESNADGPFRAQQFEILLDAIEDFSPTGPVLIGGDLNTGNHVPPDFDWRTEGLFPLAEQKGFSWDFTAPGFSTRASLISPHADRVMKLDWIAGRGVACVEKGIKSSLGKSEKPLSDHDLVWASVGMAV